MRLSGLVVAANLLISATLFAQHTSGTSVPSASSASSSSPSSTSSSSASISHPSSASSSASSSSSSNSGASHSSYSGGSSSSSSGSSASSHGSGSSSSIDSHVSSSHGSPGGSSSASSHNSGGSASHVANTGAPALHASEQTLRSSSERALREPNPEPNRKTPVGVGKLNPPSSKLPPSQANAPPEKKSFFSRLRHPFKPKPVKTAEFKRPPPCRKEPCAVCPPGASRNGKGACVAPVVAINQCQPGQTWNGGACIANATCQPGTFWNGVSCTVNASECVSYDSRAALLANELRGIRDEMERACTQNPMGQRCRELTLQHDGALLRYRMLLNEAPVRCRVTLPDPLSL